MIRRYPAEWERQVATWLAWPHHALNWGARPDIHEFYEKLIRWIARFQPVNVLIPPDFADPLPAIARQQTSANPVQSFCIPTNDIWIRDYGPFFMATTAGPFIVSYSFNAWGNKFPPFDLDDQVPARLASHFSLPIETHEFILEGGALEFDGLGTALTTLDCLVGPQRNPESKREAIEKDICKAFGLSDLLVLPFGLVGDHTDGHIDNLVRFVAPGHLVMNRTDDMHSENYERLREVKDRLSHWMSRRSERGWRIDEISLPPQESLGEEILPASHMNFIFVNGALLVPFYLGGTDDEAIAILQRALPDRKVEGMDCRLVIEEGGSLHCMSKQQPAE